MQKPFLTAAFLAASFLAPGVHAQAPAPVVTPASPAPAVANAPAAEPNQVIYVPRLPSANELTNAAAAAQGVAVERIEQTSTQITITYRYANGQTNTVAYQLLPTGSNVAPTQTTVVQSAPAVVYAPPPRVIYYEEPVYYPRYYYPYSYYPPVSLSFGFGYRHFGGGFHHRH